MKVTVLQENFLPRLSAVARVASAKSALPVLENVLLTAEKGVLRLVATDLETGIKTAVGAKVEREGATTVPARTLVSLIGNLSPGKLVLESEKDILVVTAEGFSAKINGLPATDFPALAEAGKALVTLSAEDFKEAINQVSFAAAQDESRPILTGLLLKLAGGIFTLVGVDGFRLGEKKLKLSGEDFATVVPARSLIEAARLVAGEVEISVSAEGQLFLKTGDFLIFAQVLEGEFPEYEQIIPTNFETHLRFEKEELAKAVQLTTVFTDSGMGVVVLDYDPEKKLLEVSSQEAERGEARVEISVGGEGKKGTIAFNSRYVGDALSALPGEEVELSLNSNLDPAMFTTPKDPAYRHVIMPVRLQE